MKIVRLSGRVRTRTGAPSAQPIDLMATRSTGRVPQSGMGRLAKALNGGGRRAPALTAVASRVRRPRAHPGCQDLGKNGCLVTVCGLRSATQRASSPGRASGVSGDGPGSIASGSCR
jgi:hypothetical protein